MTTFIRKDASYMSSRSQNELIGIVAKYIFQKWHIEENKKVNYRSISANKVYVCMCVCMYVCMYVYMYVCVCMYITETVIANTIMKDST